MKKFLIRAVGSGFFILAGLCVGSSVQAEFTAEELLKLNPDLVNYRKINPNVLFNLVYTTTDNFTGQDLYGDFEQCLLLQDASDRLNKAFDKLQEIDGSLTFKLYDCLRPRRVQRKMWEVVKDTPQRNYLSDPNKSVPSVHNYGCAVDLTLATKQGKELDMGTPVDFLGKLAEPRNEISFLWEDQLTHEQIKFRLLLRHVMVSAGFFPISNEWWHFNCASRKHVAGNYKLIE